MGRREKEPNKRLTVFNFFFFYFFFSKSVTSYDVKTATVRLGHVYPPGTNVLVAVDLRLVLETIEPGMTSVGEWVNVIGYVVGGWGSEEGADGRVQALVMWSTGPLDVGEYERAVEGGMALESGS